jgi:hypothetical protein
MIGSKSKINCFSCISNRNKILRNDALSRDTYFRIKFEDEFLKCKRKKWFYYYGDQKNTER